MKRDIFCIISLSLCVFLFGCEISPSVPSYQYSQKKGQTVFYNSNEEDLIRESPNYPTQQEEELYVGKLENEVILNETQQDKIIDLVDIMLQGLYRMSFVSDSTDHIARAYSIMNQQLKKQICSSGMYEALFYATKYNNIDVDIERLTISDYVTHYRNDSVGDLIRVVCSLKISVNSKNTLELSQVFPQYSIGNMNRVDLYLYLKENDMGEFSLYAYREVTINPLTVIWYTPNGIMKECLNTVKLYTIENDPTRLYSQVEYLCDSEIDPSVHTKIENTLTNFAKAIFDCSSIESQSKINTIASSALNRQYEIYREQALQSLYNNVLVSCEYNCFDTLRVFTDGDKCYYETFLVVNYESKTDEDITHLTFGELNIPIGSYSAIVRALVTTYGDYEVYNWTLLSVTDKSPGINTIN